MNPISASRAGWMLALALAGAPSSLPAQEPPPTQVAPASAESFDAEFDQALSFTRRRMWKSAHAAWLELLRRHAGAVYVRPRLPEIRELVRKCAFWQVTREPEAKSCISGKLLLFDRTSGRIRIQYRPDQLADFEETDGVRVYPAHFTGPYSIEVVGLPEDVAKVEFVVAIGTDRAYAARAGWSAPGQRQKARHQLVELVEPKPSPVGFAEAETRAADRQVSAEISVSAREIGFAYDGSTVVEEARVGKGFGGFALRGSIGFDSLLVSGTVDTGWIDGLVDAKVQAEREAFEAKWVEPAEFATWPSLRPTEARLDAIERLIESVELIAAPTPEQVQILADVDHDRRENRSAEAIDKLEALTDDQLPQATRELLLAYCSMELDRSERALAHLDARARLVPPDFTLQYLRANVLGKLERESEAIEILSRLAAEQREEQVVLYTLAELCLLSGRHEEARATLDRALERVGSSAEFEELRSKLAKATVGPGWSRSFTQRSDNFLVESDVDAATAMLAARVLQDSWKDCQRVFGAFKHPETRTRAYVFSGRASYDAYVHGIADDGIDNTAGLYSRTVDQILAWNQVREADMLSTLRHECVHRYVELALGLVPRWYDEGLAEYFAACKSSDGKWSADAVAAEHMAFYRRDFRVIPLATFLRERNSAFMATPERHYAQAWAFVHFLRNTRHENARAFERRLWLAFKEKTDASSAVEAALQGVDLDALQEQFMTYVRNLLTFR